MYCEIENETALTVLMDRVRFWTDDSDTLELYEQYYSRMIDEQAFSDFDVMSIVDNDYINFYDVATREEIENNYVDGFEDWRVDAEYNGYYLYYVG